MRTQGGSPASDAGHRVGSIPTIPTDKRTRLSTVTTNNNIGMWLSLARASAWGAEDRRFESSHPDYLSEISDLDNKH